MDAVKMPAPLNMRREDYFQSVCNKYDKMIKNSHERLCFMYTEGFENSKRFARFVTENKNILITFIKKRFRAFNYSRDEGAIDDVYRTVDSFVNFLSDSVLAKFHFKSDEVWMNEDEFKRYSELAFEYDISQRSRRYMFSPIWEQEKQYYSVMRKSDDGDKAESQECEYDEAVYEILKLWMTRSDNAAYNSFFSESNVGFEMPSFREIVEFQLRELCRYRIQSIAFIDKELNESTYYKKGLLKEDDCIGFLLELLDALIIEAEHVIEYVYRSVRNDTSIGMQIAEFKKQVECTQESYVNQINELNAQNKACRQQLANVETAYKEIEKKLFTANENAVKPLRKEISDCNKKIEQQTKKYKSLLAKYEALTEYAEQFEMAEDDTLSVDISVDDIPAEVFAKKIVFIREKQYSNYTMMRKLNQYFPNANFTNGVSGDIDMDTTDMVVLLTRYTKHGTYWGARDASRRAGLTCIHCAYTNISSIIKTIADCVQ